MNQCVQLCLGGGTRRVALRWHHRVAVPADDGAEMVVAIKARIDAAEFGVRGCGGHRDLVRSSGIDKVKRILSDHCCFPYESVTMYGMYAPANSPAMLINRLNQEAARFLNMPDTNDSISRCCGRLAGAQPGQQRSK